ncbi:hypothetical protein [Grimontia hollisae]|uniref:hypothetical protein n=1 Tax=Grimontia hollisae TaxID=673 RepID=UPI001E59EE89|nr:hypothetical protein [Grimontia hollisae]
MTTPVVQYTKAGLAELISAKNQGIKGAIKWIAAGSRSYEPSADQTALLAEKQRELIVDWEELSPTQLRMAAPFKGNLEYEVREVGFFLKAAPCSLCIQSLVSCWRLNHRMAAGCKSSHWTFPHCRPTA